MDSPVSAILHEPSDFVREVSADAIKFYVNGLSKIYLPDGFKQANAGVLDVECWKPEDRLCGKFGRFALLHAVEGAQAQLDDILMMGTTIGLSGVSHYGLCMASLRHNRLEAQALHILRSRGLDKGISVEPADYGSTTIVLDKSGKPQSVVVDGSSVEFGRANTEGRERTCELFRRLLGGDIGVDNAEPSPREFGRIISS